MAAYSNEKIDVTISTAIEENWDTQDFVQSKV